MNYGKYSKMRSQVIECQKLKTIFKSHMITNRLTVFISSHRFYFCSMDHLVPIPLTRIGALVRRCTCGVLEGWQSGNATDC